MSFAPMDSMRDSDAMQPASPLQKILQQLVLKRRKNISPNPADGFLTVGGKADSDAEGAADVTTNSGLSPLQN